MGAALYVPEDRPPPSADRVPTLTEVVELLAPPAPEEPPAEVVEAVEVELVIPEWNAAGAEFSEPSPPVQTEEPVAAQAPVEPPALAAAAPAPAPEVDPEELVSLVMKELAPRVDLMLEARLREALAPALARAADGLIRDARQELGTTLRELVHEAVARTLRQRDPG